MNLFTKTLKGSVVIPFCLLVVFALFLSSCATKRISDSKPLEKTLLWEITGKGIKQPSYIFGTIHLIDSDAYFLPDGTMRALENAEKVIFEIDMNEMNDMSALMGMMGKIFMKDNQTLKDLLSDEDYQLVREHFQSLGLPVFMLERMKPMFLSVFANGDMDPSGLQNGKMKSYEMEFLSLCNSMKKETGGLESIDFQISLFDDIPYKTQANMLVSGIKGVKSGFSTSVDDLAALYTSQDIDSMAEMISTESGEMDGIEDKLVIKRNQNWIAPILQESRKQPTFFAVGAGHLGGKNGVIRLLRKAGVKVKPLKKAS